MIPITKPYLPSFKKYERYLHLVYKYNWLTNNGVFVRELEKRLSEYLNVPDVILVANGTLALQIAYKLLNLNNNVLTTPFSFVATTSSLVWENLSPVFVDINPENLCMDDKYLKEYIDYYKPNAILPINVFGNAPNIEKIERISKRYNIPVIFDSSHCFNVYYKNKNILNYGDISTISFHATKLFHTIEGGALIIKNEVLNRKARRIINFGYENGQIKSLGINAKMNELEAIMGLCVLDDIDIILESRYSQYMYYYNQLKDLLIIPQVNKNITKYNYSYFPIIFETKDQRKIIQQELNNQNIIPRRYFTPSLNNLPYLKNQIFFPVSESISEKILVLPMYVGLTKHQQQKIIDIIKKMV